MALITILLCLILQRGFNFDYLGNFNWFDIYYDRLKHSMGSTLVWNGIPGVAVVILPLLIVYIAVAFFIYQLFTAVGYYLLSLFVLYYCMQSRPIIEEHSQATAEQIFSHSYQRLFAIIFWFLILGSTGAVLYMLVLNLQRLNDQKTDPALSSAITLVQGILDWIPVRLTGISFALVGHFLPTFKLWYQQLFTGIGHIQDQLVEWGLMSLGILKEKADAFSYEEREAVDGLVTRTLWLWLVMIALFTIGHWLG